DDGSSEHRASAGRRRHANRAPVFWDGVGAWHQDHRLLRSEQPRHGATARFVHPGLPRRATCASKRNYPPRHPAVENPGDPARQDVWAAPKVIGSGIAKAIEGRLAALTVYLEPTNLIGPPAFVVPHNAEMRGLNIDTRSDFYSLGVLFYELRTECTPFEPHEL